MAYSKLLVWIFFVLLVFIATPRTLALSVIEDFWLEMDDGVKLDLTRITPAEEAPQGGFPAIVFVHGLRGSKENMMRNARTYTDSGFVTVTYSVRGQGDSEGLSTLFSYREQEDLEFIIDWLGDNPVVDNTAIGVSGASQGGFHSWFAAVKSMNVRAVAPENSCPEREDAGLRYECYSTALTVALESDNALRVDTLFYPLKRLLLADDYDSVRAIIARGRSFDSTAVAASSATYLMMGAWHDHVFWHNRMPGAFSVAPQPSYMYLGVGGHSSGHSLTEALYREDLRYRFFAENLKGEDHDLYTVGPVVDALGPDWVHFEIDKWPPSTQEFLTYYLLTDSTLSLQSPGPSDSSWRIDHTLIDPSYTWTDAVVDKFSHATNAFHVDRRSWTSEPLSETLRIVGIPTAQVYAKGPTPRFQINLQLYAESPEGFPTYLSQISLGQRDNPDSSVWHMMKGEFVIVGWEIPPGYRLRVDWASINKTLEDTTLWTVPYWDADGTLTLGLDAQHPASIRIPVLGRTTIKGDTNGNSAVDILDAVVAVHMILDLGEYTADQHGRADCNGTAGICDGDGVVNIFDVVKIINLILGLDACP